MVGAALAKMTTAPNAILVSETGIFDGKVEELPTAVSDTRLGHHASAWLPCYRYCGFLMQKSEKIDLGFLGGAQIDAYGNLNSTCIGDYCCSKTRLTGSGGANGIATYLNTVIVMGHEKRRFVEKLDYVTSPGWIDGTQGRRRLGLPENKGPVAVVTTLGVMRFEDQSKRMFLSEYYPGVTPNEVIEKTGFPIEVSNAVQLEPPDDYLLEMLRKTIDPSHIYV